MNPTLTPNARPIDPQFAILRPNRLLHYVSAAGVCRPAAVARVVDRTAGVVDLRVFEHATDAMDWLYGRRSTGILSAVVIESVPFSAALVPASWHWVQITCGISRALIGNTGPGPANE